MTWKETLERLLAGLRTELRKKWGQIGEIEARASLRRGDLSDFYSGRKTIKLDLLLRVLDVLELDSGAFFARALGTGHRPEDVLEDIADAAGRDAALGKVTRATGMLESAAPPPADLAADAGSGDIAELAGCSRPLQQRRLRSSGKYRNHAFTSAYLEHLESLRYDNPSRAAKLAMTVAVALIPTLPGPQTARLSMLCLTLGIFGSARRLEGRFASAAAAFQLALELARRHRLQADLASLLQRASYLLRDHGRFEPALLVLREALELYLDVGDREGVAKVLVDRGMMLCYLGDFEAAECVLGRALDHLAGSEAVDARNHFAAYQYLAYSREQQGDLAGAERWLEEAIRVKGLERGFYWGKLRWQQGTLAFRRGDYPRSEALLRAARAVFEKEEPGQQVLLAVDLLEALVAQGKTEEAGQLAKGMASLLARFRNNRLMEAAVTRIVSSALTDELSLDLLAEVRRELRRGRAPGGPRQSWPGHPLIFSRTLTARRRGSSGSPGRRNEPGSSARERSCRGR